MLLNSQRCDEWLLLPLTTDRTTKCSPKELCTYWHQDKGKCILNASTDQKNMMFATAKLLATAESSKAKPMEGWTQRTEVHVLRGI
jgi:hypothetical protein